KAIASGAVSEAGALTAHLLEKTLPEGAVRLGEYYAATPGVEQALQDGLGSIPIVRPDLPPEVAEALGVRPGEVLGEQELQNLISGRRADGGELEGAQRRVGTYEGKSDGQKDRHSISGFDMVFSAPKSVSIAWAFAKTEAERATILQAHRDARDAALAYIEKEIGFARLGKGGRGGTEPGRFGWISIDHFTARPTVNIRRPDPETGVMGTEVYTLNPNTPGDPHLHTHNIVPNVIVSASGRVVSIHRDLFAHRVHEFGAVYQAFLADNLRAAGVEVDLCGRTNMATVSIIPQAVCDEFSKRTADAEASARDAARSRGLDWDAMDAAAKVRFLKGGAKASRRAKSDDLSNFTDWFNQAADMGWAHETAVTAPTPRKSDDDRLWAAYDTALPLLEGELTRNAVIHGTDARLQAVRGLIKHGISTTDDISKVTRLMVQEGVRQDGKPTTLLWSDGGDARVKVTTALHRDQEAELIRLAREAAADKTHAISGADLSFTKIANDEQRAAGIAMAEGGAFGVFIGVAGSGKTVMTLPPLVKAAMARGMTVWGVAQAWRQAEALAEAGIPRFNTRALQPFLLGVAEGRTKVDANSVVIIDELSQVGSRQLLQLLRLREKHGFKIVACGDHRQAASVEAGPVIDLLRIALGEDAIPQILTTNRQRSTREREIAGLFREGKKEAAARAIDMKLADGTVEAVDGGYDA
ncbi:MAG: relaxase domain-containing protein, partial [Parafilimonas terrae]|nr:relaxase domain-containing protein [Parafilimonas terrae]